MAFLTVLVAVLTAGACWAGVHLKRALVGGLLLLLWPTLAAAQVVTVGPVTTAMRFEWAAGANVTTAVDALTFEYRLRDGAFIPVTALTGVACAWTPIVCTSPMSQANADALNRVGSHTLTLSAFRMDLGDSVLSLPFRLTSPVDAPTNLRIMR